MTTSTQLDLEKAVIEGLNQCARKELKLKKSYDGHDRSFNIMYREGYVQIQQNAQKVEYFIIQDDVQNVTPATADSVSAALVAYARAHKTVAEAYNAYKSRLMLEIARTKR